jgi:hypothetical protein
MFFVVSLVIKKLVNQFSISHAEKPLKTIKAKKGLQQIRYKIVINI